MRLLQLFCFAIILITPTLISAQGAEVTREEMEAYFVLEDKLTATDIEDVPEVLKAFVPMDSVRQILISLEEKSQTATEEEMVSLQATFNDQVEVYERKEYDFQLARETYRNRVISQPGTGLTPERHFKILQLIQSGDSKTNELHKEVMIDRYNEQINSASPVIDNMSDDSFTRVMKIYAEYIHKSSLAAEMTQAAERGEFSKREAFKARIDLSEWYEDLIEREEITEEEMTLMNEAVNNSYTLSALAQALGEGEVTF